VVTRAPTVGATTRILAVTVALMLNDRQNPSAKKTTDRDALVELRQFRAAQDVK
jgi:hypothetical protein